MSNNYEYVKTSRRNLKRRLVYVHGGECCVCGYNKCIEALQFHHLNPQEKEFSLSGVGTISFEKAVKETEKCILVCSNCHKEIHANLITIPQQYTTLDLTKKKEIEEEIENFKTKQIFYCKNCGKIISKKAEFCPECFHLQIRKVENRPSREELKELIRNKPFLQIGKDYNVSDNAIRKWCVSYNLPKTKKEINSYSEEEWDKI